MEPELPSLFDELLVTLAQAGDRAALDRLAVRWHRRLARTARRLLQDEEAALEAAQDAWLAIQRSLGALHDPARFAPWAFAILRRRCIERMRRSARERESIEPQAAQGAVAPPQGDALAIAQAFAALPPDQRLAAQLFYVEQLSLAEIAEAAACPVGTIKSRLFHARRKLKSALSDTSGEPT